jgi:hypothetical protein
MGGKCVGDGLEMHWRSRLDEQGFKLATSSVYCFLSLHNHYIGRYNY